MAGALTPEQRDAVNKTFLSVDNAIDKVVERSPALRQLWEDGQNPLLWPNRREFEEYFWSRALPELPELGIVVGQPAPTTKAKTPRHRPPDEIPRETVKGMKWELAQRKARPPRDPEFTQQAIADRLGVDRTRVQQAEALERVGWDLLRSHPEFSADDGFVRWPSVEKASQTLAFERAEN